MELTKEDLTPAIVNSVLNYDPDSGHFTWCSKHHSKRVVVGSRAGYLHKASGYREVALFGRTYKEHILAWFVHYGCWPSGEVDHVDHVRDHNWITNLEDKSHAQNARNKARLTNTVSGMQGIWFNKKRDRWVAEIRMNGKKVWQKSFRYQTDALEARRIKLIELGFHENHGNI